MKRFFVGHDLEVNKTYKIDGIEHNHIKNVMRMSVNDELILVCGDECDYYGKIVAMSKGDTSVFVTGCEKIFIIQSAMLPFFKRLSNRTICHSLFKNLPNLVSKLLYRLKANL